MTYRRPTHPFLDAPLPLAFAHRGGASAEETSHAPEFLENTMSAFASAVDAGFRYVETDVHATADGELVAFHDPILDRVTDRQGEIAALPLTEVLAARIGGDEQIPLLADVLGTWPELRINIDPKSDAAVGPLIEVIQRCKAIDRVCIGSFSTARLRTLRAALGPDLATSMGPREVLSLRLGSLLPFRASATPVSARQQGPVAAQVPERRSGIRIVDRRFIDAAHRRGLHVHVWTIDDAPTMNRLLDLGVDGIMTDRIDVLREVYSARGHWPPE
jgi:glycerophosphoryl diester phosphodiesterase